MKRKVLVLMGGNSLEREVSLRSGQAVCEALLALGHEVVCLDFVRENITRVEVINPDIVFIALHGQDGEDGAAQGYLDLLGIPYTGSGLAASVVCMDKLLTKKLLLYEGLPTADFIAVRKGGNQKIILDLDATINKLGLPLVVKPANQGSSIGTFIVKKKEEILPAVEEAAKVDHTILLEKYLDGPLLEITVLGNEKPKVLPMIEVTTENEFYDYEAKYKEGGSEHIIPPRISGALKEKVETISLAAYRAAGCRGFARLDVMADKQDNPYILEINTVPGLTATSLVPDSARAAGLSFSDLIQNLLDLALEN